MGDAHRQSTSHLVEELYENPKQFSFYRAVELLLKDRDHQIEERGLQRQSPDGLMFHVHPGLGFPGSDLSSIEAQELDDKPLHILTTNFLGLHGSSSPLPTHLVESAALSRVENGVQQHFQDFFSNRLIWLFYMSWRKYRYHVRFRPEAQDQFSNWMFSLIGLEGKASRVKSDVPWSKLLTYLGVISARTRSPETVSGVIAHAFNIERVSIDELQMRKVLIPKDQQTSLGQRNAVLGQDALIGTSVKDITGKFVINLHGLHFKRFRDFLPSGQDFNRLKVLVEFLLKDQLAFDLKLNLKQKERPSFKLGKDNVSNLGWTTFVGEKSETSNSVTLQVRA